MKGINIARTLIEGLNQRYANAQVFFFDGTMPATVADLAFDVRNVLALRAASVGYSGNITIEAPVRSGNTATLSLNPLSDSSLSFPSLGVTSFQVPTKFISLSSTSGTRADLDAAFPTFESINTHNAFLDMNNDSNWIEVGRGVNSIYIEVPKLVNSTGDALSITGYAVKQQGIEWISGEESGQARATSMSLAHYDSVQEDFVDSASNSTDTDNVFVESLSIPSSDNNEFRLTSQEGADYPEGITSGAGNPHWSVASFCLLTDQEPFIDPLDAEFRTITWAVIVPFVFTQSTDTESYVEQYTYLADSDTDLPVILCDVGTVGSGAGIEIKKVDTSLYLSPEIVKLNLEFKD